jgi:hypothetical protein
MPDGTARPRIALGPALLAGRHPRAHPSRQRLTELRVSTFHPHAIRIEQSTKGESEP